MLKTGHARVSLSGIQKFEKIVFSLRVCVRRVLVIPVAAQRNTGIPCFKQGDPGIFRKIIEKNREKTGMTTQRRYLSHTLKDCGNDMLKTGHGDIYRNTLKDCGNEKSCSKLVMPENVAISVASIQKFEKIVFSLRMCVLEKCWSFRLQLSGIPESPVSSREIPVFFEKIIEKTGMTTHGDIYRTRLKIAGMTCSKLVMPECRYRASKSLKRLFSRFVCVCRKVLVIPVAAQRNTGIPCFKQGDPGIFRKIIEKPG
ncbi:MAG: hypothetical protein H6629_14980 [Calditrichae bacterium]|nr:hypothetical protein [Calditrichia bacterium]